MAAGPLIAAGASLLGGITGGKGAAKAAKIQAKAYQAGIDEQARQFNTTQQNFAPYQRAGSSAIAQIMQLLGLGGLGGSDAAAAANDPAGGSSATDQQAHAIQALKASPLFTSQYDTGVDTILQNKAATGGLRGGDTQNSLAQYGSGLLSDVIQRQLASLGGLSSLGASAAGGLGTLGQSNANSTAELLAKQGGANATAAGAPYAALQGIISALGAQGGGLSGLFSGGASPLGVSSAITSAQPIGSTAGLGGLLGGLTIPGYAGGQFTYGGRSAAGF